MLNNYYCISGYRLINNTENTNLYVRIDIVDTIIIIDESSDINNLPLIVTAPTKSTKSKTLMKIYVIDKKPSNIFNFDRKGFRSKDFLIRNFNTMIKRQMGTRWFNDINNKRNCILYILLDKKLNIGVEFLITKLSNNIPKILLEYDYFIKSKPSESALITLMLCLKVINIKIPKYVIYNILSLIIPNIVSSAILNIALCFSKTLDKLKAGIYIKDFILWNLMSYVDKNYIFAEKFNILEKLNNIVIIADSLCTKVEIFGMKYYLVK